MYNSPDTCVSSFDTIFFVIILFLTAQDHPGGRRVCVHAPVRCQARSYTTMVASHGYFMFASALNYIHIHTLHMVRTDPSAGRLFYDTPVVKTIQLGKRPPVRSGEDPVLTGTERKFYEHTGTVSGAHILPAICIPGS